jgi:hypothetical protein
MPLTPIFKWSLYISKIHQSQSHPRISNGGAHMEVVREYKGGRKHCTPNGTAFVQLSLSIVPLAFHCLPAEDTDLLTVSEAIYFLNHHLGR